MLKTNTSTAKNKSPLAVALGVVSPEFRQKIVKHFLDLKKRLAEANDESVGLAAGKFCETVLRFIQQQVLGTFIPFSDKIGDFSVECRKLIQAPKAAGSESVRVVIPRALLFVYTLRNKRGIGHVGGDVDANRIDAITIARACDWVLCELIRVYHNVSLEEAQSLLDGLAERNIPDIWNVAGKKRVLKPGLGAKDQVLLLCYADSNTAILAEDLQDWVEYSDLSLFKKRVLKPLHSARMIEYDEGTDTVQLSPLGTKDVEERILAPE